MIILLKFFRAGNFCGTMSNVNRIRSVDRHHTYPSTFSILTFANPRLRRFLSILPIPHFMLQKVDQFPAVLSGFENYQERNIIIAVGAVCHLMLFFVRFSWQEIAYCPYLILSAETK